MVFAKDVKQMVKICPVSVLGESMQALHIIKLQTHHLLSFFPQAVLYYL